MLLLEHKLHNMFLDKNQAVILNYFYKYYIHFWLLPFSLHNAIAVFEGLIGKKSPFVRTPKFNVNATKGTKSWSSNKYLVSTFSVLSIFELLFGIYFVFGLFLGFKYHDFGLFPFHLMLSFGYFYVFINSTFHSLISSNRK